MRIGTIQQDGTLLLHDKNIKYRDAMTGHYQRIRNTTKQRVWLSENGFTPITSSFISGAGVKDDDLYIRFHNASVYVYYGLAKYYDNLLLSNSKGQYFHRAIRPTLRYKKLSNMPFPNTVEPSPLEFMEDEQLFDVIDFDYIKRLTSQMTGATLYAKDILIDGIEFTQYTVNELVILRPKILSQ